MAHGRIHIPAFTRSVEYARLPPQQDFFTITDFGDDGSAAGGGTESVIIIKGNLELQLILILIHGSNN